MSEPGPYKGLAPFEDSELDASFFFGRSRERDIITANLTAARLTLLYGLSGVGKSSILKAAVVRRLRALPGPLAVVVFDRWRDDPGLRLREAVAGAVGEQPQGSLGDTLEAATAHLGGELYIILDAAEEYFVYHGGETGPGTFEADFTDAVTRPGLRAYFLLSLREDALAGLDRFKPSVPQLFANSLRLEHLDRAAAHEAIVGPIERYNELSPDARVGIEPELVEAVLDQVASGRVDVGRTEQEVPDGGGSPGQVETPYLSLVMERLWGAEQAAGSRLLRLSTLEALGGAEQIVRDHLDDALAALPASSQAAAAQVFTHLVTRSGTKIAHTAADLADYAGVPEEELVPVLQALASQRILRPAAGANGSGRYEIFHDVLAAAVVAWRSGYATRQALERERDAHRRRVRRLLIVIAIALVALAGMAAVTVFALAQRSTALRERTAVRTANRHLLGRELVLNALAQLRVDPELSLLLGLEAAKQERTPAVEDALRRALEASHVRAVLNAGGKSVSTVAFSRDSKLLGVGGADGVVRIFGRDGELRRKLRHGARLTGLSFDPAGRLLMSTGRDGTPRVWSVRSGKILYALPRAGRAGAFSSDGALIITAGEDGGARIWQTSDGSLVQVLAHGGPVRSAALNPTGRLALTLSGGEARIFDVRRGYPVLNFPQQDVTSATFSRSGAFVATTVADTVTVWSVAEGTLVWTFTHRSARVTQVGFKARGDALVSVAADGNVRVWSLVNGQRLAVIRGHSDLITSASFSPPEPGERDGKWILTSSRDGSARVSNADTGTLWADLRGHEDVVTAAAFGPDGRRVATASKDGTARIWDAHTYPDLAAIGSHDGPALRASFSPNGRRIVSAGADGTARIWRAETPGKPVAVLPHGAQVNDASFSPDGNVVATASADGTARLWTPSGKALRTLQHGAAVRTAAFSVDGDLVVTATLGGEARIWRVADGRAGRRLEHPRAVLAASFSPDGKSVLTIAADRVARIWRSDGSGAPVELRGRARLVSASFSPNGSQVLTASADGSARLWEVSGGRLLHVLKGHRRALTSASFSPDGSLVLTASQDHDVRVWDVASGKLRRVIKAHLGVVNGASFSPDGRWIVTAGPSAAGLWPAGSSVREAYLLGSQEPLRSASFSSDGRSIVTAGLDGNVRLNRCEVCGTLAELVDLAEQRLARTGRKLTPAERAKYLQS